MKAKAVEYVKICSLYGAGFYYIPGTDTCIKLGGYLRAEVALNSNSDFNFQASGNNGARNRLTNYYTIRAREDLNIDTRTATGYGVSARSSTASLVDDRQLQRRRHDGTTAYAACSHLGAATAPLASNNATDGRYRGRYARRLLRLHPVRWLHHG